MQDRVVGELESIRMKAVSGERKPSGLIIIIITIINSWKCKTGMRCLMHSIPKDFSERASAQVSIQFKSICGRIHQSAPITSLNDGPFISSTQGSRDNLMSKTDLWEVCHMSILAELAFSNKQVSTKCMKTIADLTHTYFSDT